MQALTTNLILDTRQVRKDMSPGYYT